MLALLLSVISAQAGGYYLPDSGIVALGRGGAFVATADNQFAQYYNPAGLAWVKRPTLNAGLSGVQQRVTFARLDEDGTEQPAVENESPPYLVPQLGFATPLGDTFGFAFGFTSPIAPGSDYDPTGAQRYSIINTLIWQFSVGPSLAWRPVPWISVGASFQWNVLRVEEELTVTTSGATDPSGDVGVRADVLDLFTPGFNLGVVLQPVDVLKIGLAVQPPSNYRAKGSGTLDFSSWGGADLLTETVYTDDDISLGLSLPLVVRAGVGVLPHDRVEVELAAVYERWSTLGDLLVEGIDVTVQSEILGNQAVDDTISLPAGFRDTFSVRLGGEVEVTDALAVRAGGLWERAALAPEEVSLALVDTDKFQVGAGVSAVLFDRLGLDLSGAYLAYRDLEITDSKVTQVNVYGGDGAVVGNGDLDVDGWVVGGQLSWAFGANPQKED